MRGRGFAHIAAQALVPEQITGYVTAVGHSSPILCADCVAYDLDGRRTLIAYAPGSSPDGDHGLAVEAMNKAVAAALADGTCETLTVLGPARPGAAPPDASGREDAYAFMTLPMAAPGQNLRNMLRRGERECSVSVEEWKDDHATLVRAYLDARPLEAGTRHIYSRIPDYLAAVPGTMLFAARNGSGNLLAFAVGDFSSLTTACYMFAFRADSCPPGVADTLLYALVREAENQGHQYMNLGLGINKGIAAFKRKWGITHSLPCVQTAWAVTTPPRAPAGRFSTDRDPMDADPLDAFIPPSLTDNLRDFFSGARRPFECLQIEVTSRCPARCGYCPHTTKSHAWRSRRMEDETFAALLPLIRRTGRAHLQGWGEPLLHPRFFEYAAAARRTGCAVSTTTCGLGMTDENAAKLVACGIDIAAFSLAGTDEAGNAVRDGAPFSLVRESILALNRAKAKAGSETPRVHLAYLMLASKMKDAANLPELMRDLGVPVAVVSTLDYIAAPGLEKEAFAPGETAKIEAARTVLHETAERAAAMGLKIHYSLPGQAGRRECSERVDKCMYIDADGVIAPCIYLNLPTTEEDPYRRTYGAATERNPLAIWNDPGYMEFRKRLRDGNPDAPCAACPKRFERVF